MTHPTKEILIVDDEASGSFRHVNLHPQVAAAHTYSVVQTLYMPIGSVFGANVVPHNWEVFAQSRCKKTEHLQSSLDLPTIVQNHSAIIDLIKLPKNAPNF